MFKDDNGDEVSLEKSHALDAFSYFFFKMAMVCSTIEAKSNGFRISDRMYLEILEGILL